MAETVGTGGNVGLSIDELPVAEDRTRAWQQLREAGDVVPSGSGNEFMLTGADVCEFAAKRADIFSSARAFQQLAGMSLPLEFVPLGIDPPDHSRYRRILDPFFGPKRMAEREPELRKQIGERIDAIQRKGECDFIKEVAVPFPSQVFLTLFGLPLEDADKLVRWKDAIFLLLDRDNLTSTPESIAPGLELFAYMAQHIENRSNDTGGGADLLSQLLSAPEGERLTEAEILGLSLIFIFAGLDTVTGAVGLAFARLATDIELRRRIRDDYSLIPSFIEEQLRVDGPVVFLPRITNEDVELGGVHVPKDSNIMMVYSSANRDPRRFKNPDTVNLDEPQPSFAFGRGPHRCLGSHLARLELRIILEEWHNRIPEYRIADGANPKPLWPNSTLGYDSLPLVVG